MLLGLIDASGSKLIPGRDILTYCYHYDPQTVNTSIIARVVQSVAW
jgi:protein SCO1/2